MIQFDAIVPGVFVGSCPSSATDITRLRSGLGVTAVLNLQTDDDFARWGIDWPGLLAAYETHGVTVVRSPIRDFDRDDLKQRVGDAANDLDRLVAVGHTVYVHCTAGLERSPATVIGYLVQCRGYSLDEAVAEVTTQRTCRPYVDVLEAVYSAADEDPEASR